MNASRVMGRFWEVVTALVALLMVAPIVWMFSTSFKPEQEAVSLPPRWLPQHSTSANYADLFTKAEDFPVLRWLFNSVFVSVSVTLLVLLVSSMAAFALSRLKFRGRSSLFMAIVASMIIPGQVTLIPAFLIVTRLGMFDNYLGLIVPGIASAFGVFLLRQFFLGIPAELEEAAFLDGAGLWTVYSRVIMPLSKPALATLAIFTFMGAWNDFVWPLIVTNDMNLRTLPVGLSIFQGRYTTQYGITMAAAAITTIPMILAFLVFQKRITEGIALTGLK